MLKKFFHQKILNLIRKIRIRKHNQMLINTLLHEFTNYKNHFSIFRIRKSSNHFNQKKEDNDLRHILSHNLKKHNENHLHNNKKMIQTN